MKMCGCMEVCGLGFPRSKPMDHDWADCLKQANAQNCGMLIGWSRAHTPEESDFFFEKRFTKVNVGYDLQSVAFENPRTTSHITLWVKIKDTKEWE